MEKKIKKGDKIRIKENLMAELVKFGFKPNEMADFVNHFINTEQTVLDVYHDTDNGTNSLWVTVEMCCEIPISSCEIIKH